MRHHIHYIRQSDQATKLKWLIGLSIATTVIIAVAWVFYMRAFVFTSVGPGAKEDVRVGFWSVFKNGLAMTEASVARSFDGMFSSIPRLGGRTTTITNPE